MNKHVAAAMEKMDNEYSKEIVPSFAVKGFDPDKDRFKVEGKSRELELPFQCVEGKEEDAKKALSEFGKRFVQIDEKKLSGEVLFALDAWSPLELEVLEPIVTPIFSAPEILAEKK